MTNPKKLKRCPKGICKDFLPIKGPMLCNVIGACPCHSQPKGGERELKKGEAYRRGFQRGFREAIKSERERVIGLLKGMKGGDCGAGTDSLTSFGRGYYEAIDEAIKAIKEEGKNK